MAPSLNSALCQLIQTFRSLYRKSSDEKRPSVSIFYSGKDASKLHQSLGEWRGCRINTRTNLMPAVRPDALQTAAVPLCATNRYYDCASTSNRVLLRKAKRKYTEKRKAPRM